jgi:hypothetical protein
LFSFVDSYITMSDAKACLLMQIRAEMVSLHRSTRGVAPVAPDMAAVPSRFLATLLRITVEDCPHARAAYRAGGAFSTDMFGNVSASDGVTCTTHRPRNMHIKKNGLATSIFGMPRICVRMARDLHERAEIGALINVVRSTFKPAATPSLSADAAALYGGASRWIGKFAPLRI